MDQWDYATGMLMPGEVVVAVQQHVRLYDGEEKVQVKRKCQVTIFSGRSRSIWRIKCNF